MNTDLVPLIGSKRVCILGFGIEGQSSFRRLSACLPASQLVVADRNPELAQHPLLAGFTGMISGGAAYLEACRNCDLILKSPGIPMRDLADIPAERISSQTELFLQLFRKQIIGITGTKGKSTTSTLIHHIIRQQTPDVLLTGNIGTPPFDLMDQITPSSFIVNELSSHQLENIRVSPHIALLLNLYEEHLDHYNGRDEYFSAKMNIARFQETTDTFLFNAGDPETVRMMENCTHQGQALPILSEKGNPPCCYADKEDFVFCDTTSAVSNFNRPLNTSLRGAHNALNLLFAIGACKVAGISDANISEGIRTFQALAHRLQFAGRFHNIDFYNDSIATIPEATIAAVKAIGNVDTLILGGYDRGLTYDKLVEFLLSSSVSNFIFLGEAGKRMLRLMKAAAPEHSGCYAASSLEDAVVWAKKKTAPGKACLLSPAAASYDMFKNFEERGALFMKLAAQ